MIHRDGDSASAGFCHGGCGFRNGAADRRLCAAANFTFDRSGWVICGNKAPRAVKADFGRS